MQKIKSFIGLSLICIFSISIAKTAFADDFSDAMQQAFQEFKNESIAYYKNIENCTSGTYQDGLFIIEGQSGGYCHIKQYMLINNQKHPHLTCEIPMNEARAYAQEKINELDNGNFSYDSSTDRLNSYCTQMHNTIQLENGTISY